VIKDMPDGPRQRRESWINLEANDAEELNKIGGSSKLRMGLADPSNLWVLSFRKTVSVPRLSAQQQSPRTRTSGIAESNQKSSEPDTKQMSDESPEELKPNFVESEISDGCCDKGVCHVINR
jgi:hypothetical protein